MKVFTLLFRILNREERFKCIKLTFIMLAVAIFDVLGVASIMPFLAVLANPQIIENSDYLRLVYQFLGFSNPPQFLFWLGMAMFGALVLSLVMKAYGTFEQTRFAMFREYRIAVSLLECYLRQPYVWFLNRNSADLTKSIVSEVSLLVSSGLIPCITIVSQGTASVGLIVFLFALDPELAAVVLAVLSFCYVMIFELVKPFLSKFGEDRFDANKARYLAVNETFGSIKEIKFSSSEIASLEAFSRPARVYASVQTASSVLGAMPRYGIEVVAFGGMFALVLFLMTKNSDLSQILPLIGVYAFVGYRLMPSMQLLYTSFTQLRYSAPAIESLVDEISDLNNSVQKNYSGQKLSFREKVELRDVSFVYPKSSRPSLKIDKLEIPKGALIGVVGQTGSGKSTLIDLLLGLLSPQSGGLFVDDTEITQKNCAGWQKLIGYVPQHIYLSDKSIAANIAFGMKHDDVDQGAVERAANLACLHGFVETQLKDRYATVVGERGVRLSGGQKQRVGIARALYHQPEILVFDEATSALDGLTERAIMKTLREVAENVTVIMVTHRLTSVEGCDRIFLINNGRIEAQGTAEDLLKVSKTFQKMAKANDQTE